MKIQQTTLLFAWLPFVAMAQENTTEPAAAPETSYAQLAPFTIIGSEEAVFNMPGSSIYLGQEQLERFNFTNINSILRQAPGVYVRDEDGYGLFPNISIRGVDTNRSAKVTLMEDGILTAPAPYSAPDAYYSPTAGRMSGIEVLKGSSQVQHGPHTTSGVINYISTPIPETTEGFLELSYGTDNTINGHLWYGGKKETKLGTLGAVIELYHEQTDGFREIQAAANGPFDGSDETGYERTDYMVKLSFEPNWQRHNHFELKLGYSELDADESYLGLSDADLKNDPWDRYAASAADNILTKHFRSYLRHLLEFDPDTTLTTSLYYNAFERDWFKLDTVNGTNPAEIIETDPGVLRGESLGDFKIKSNDREYYLYGIQSKLDHSFETGELSHDLTVGARLHKDKIDRYQDAKTFTNVYAGDFDGPATITGPDTEGNREQETVALALFAHDRIETGNWAFTPGLRWEHISWDYRDLASGASADGNYSVFSGGLGLEYQIDSKSKLFGGYHHGVSLPSPGSSRNNIDEETSDTFEIGYRYQGEQSLYSEVVLFYTKLQDLVVEENLSGGGSSDENAGDIDTLGLELLIGDDLSDYFGTDYRLPVRLAFTYTDATLSEDIESASEAFIFEGESGNEVPYIPEIQVSFTAGIEFEKLSVYATVLYVDERYASALNSSEQLNNDNNQDARYGKLDSFVTVDLSGKYQLTDDLQLFAKVTNIFEEEYVTSRIPHGPRAGAPRLFSAGFNYSF